MFFVLDQEDISNEMYAATRKEDEKWIKVKKNNYKTIYNRYNLETYINQSNHSNLTQLPNHHINPKGVDRFVLAKLLRNPTPLPRCQEYQLSLHIRIIKTAQSNPLLPELQENNSNILQLQ